MDVLKIIPAGEGKAISRQSLAIRLKTDDRTAREQVRQARLRGAWIISSSRGKGYYMATSLEDWERFKRETRRRANSLLETIGEQYIPPDEHAAGMTYVRSHMRRVPNRGIPGQIKWEDNQHG